ncbi:MFS gliotoxin efflux transporter glia [Patellaria atrata CBS 101060]|uniref:MFS gliotoxin efflux transporter glia n=1 Tax=Patellaria atrata CBS 101060 TaxID=1346257 RepID=A0A9P4SIB4_9PEZI|nr:MFS gliotoxin efflux transporter glia [Patellaria atrata CBS 101060]
MSGPDERLDTIGDYPSGVLLIFIGVALLMSVFLVALDMTIVATAIPRITDEFKSIDEVGWYGSAFFLTLAAFQSTWGKLYRYCNLKFSFLIAGLIFELGSLMCGIAKSSTTLVAGRAITGFGAAGLFGGSYTIIAFIASPEKRPAYTGLVGTAYAIASVAGPLLGGVFTDTISWRWCFLINLPIGGVALGLILLLFKPPTSARPTEAPLREIILQLDLPGTIIVLACLLCFLLATQWSGVTRTWDSPNVIAVWVSFAGLLLAFILIQIRQQERAALIPRILRQRALAGVCAFAFFQNGTNFLVTYYLPIYFQVIMGATAAQSGIYNFPLIVGSCVCAALSGILIVRIGYYTPFMAFGSALFLVGAGLLYTLDINTPLKYSIGYQVILGVGQGIGIQMAVITAQAYSRVQDLSASTAIVLFFQMMGGTVCVSMGQSTFSNRLVKDLASRAPWINAESVLGTGTTELRTAFPAGDVRLILESYMFGLRDTFALSAALTGCSFVASWVAPIRSIKSLGEADTSISV